MNAIDSDFPVRPVPARNLPSSEFQTRMKRLVSLIRKRKLDAVLLTDELTNYYFTGLSSDNGLLTVTAEGPVYRTDFRYLVMAHRVAPWLTCRPLWIPSQEKDTLAALGRRWRRVGYEGSLSSIRYLAWKNALPQVEFADVRPLVAELRSVKSRAELRVIRRAVLLNDAIFQAAVSHLEKGETEWGLRTKIRGLMDCFGQGEAFDTIVCAGKNAAECHHEPDETPLGRGQSILIDMGVKVDHYCSDMTRTFFWGKPTKLYAELFRLVHEANRAAIAAIKPGVPCCEIDAVARGMIERAGYGKAFQHSLGHSFGLFIHELPGFASRCETKLKPGMVITVEPGIYLPGRIGIRIEDDILVTSTGCEVLTQTPHEVAAP